MRQQLLSEAFKISIEHGGRYGLSRRKSIRTLSGRSPMHVVMKSSLAVGELCFRKPGNLKLIRELLRLYSARFGIRIYESGVEDNHFHFLARGRRRAFQNFLRTLAGQVAQRLTGA